MVTPITFFTPSVAPSGASFYRGTAFPTFRNNLFVATLGAQTLLRITLDANDTHRVESIDRLMQGKYGRLRDVVSGPDGYLYVCTSNRDGRNTPVASDDRILRLVPVGEGRRASRAKANSGGSAWRVHMPCLLAAIALTAPRLVIAVLWIFSGWFDRVFQGPLWPVLGFVFLPTTLLWYTAVQHWFGGAWTFWPVVGLVIALAIDVSPASHRARRQE